MSPPAHDLDVLQTLTRRHEILARLEEGPCHKRDLVDDLAISRSTVDRAIRELEVFEFVDRCDGIYRLSVAGRLALGEHRRRVDSLGSIAQRSDLLCHIPREAPMSVRLLEGATVHEPKPHAPNEPFEVIVDCIDDADAFRAVIAAERVPRFRYQLYDRTVNGDLDAEAVFTDELADFFFETHSRQLRDIIERGGFELYATDSIPYGLWIIDTPSGPRVFVVVHGDSADIRGVIENRSDSALEWATETYRGVRDRARPLDAPE